MSEIWIISDTHFGHENAVSKFKRPDGTPLRPFANAAEMNEVIATNWNAKIKPQDKVYHLGDVVINKKFLPFLANLNGHKRLVRGNHDIFPTKVYMEYFEDIYGSRILDNIIFSHIPIHSDSLARWSKGNVHGHLHINLMNDPRYLNVSVEHTDFGPISLGEIKERLTRNLKDFTETGFVTNFKKVYGENLENMYYEAEELKQNGN